MLARAIAIALLVALPLGAADVPLSDRQGWSGVALDVVGAGADVPLSDLPPGARQFDARAASGAGIDLVVWSEQTSEGGSLKAARIGPAGLPLDGAGILLGEGELGAGDVAFDGEAFVVVWVQHQESASRVLMSRIYPDGSVREPLVVATWMDIIALEVAGGGAGRSAVSWYGFETSSGPRSVLTALERGIPRAPTEIASGILGYALPRLAASRDRYLAVFAEPVFCRLCYTPAHPYGRMFSLDGAALSEARSLTPESRFPAQAPSYPAAVSDGEDFFVVWDNTLVRVGLDFSISPEVTLARGGELSIHDGNLEIDHWITRAVYSRSGALLRFESRGIEIDESVAARLSRNRILVSTPAENPERLMIRSLPEVPGETADLAVVATGAISLPPPDGYPVSYATFRIEHRGGGPVSRFELWADQFIAVPGEGEGASTHRLLDRELREGESFEVAVRIFPETRSSAEPRLWVAADAFDPIPANNTDTYRRPVRSRGRTVSR